MFGWLVIANVFNWFYRPVRLGKKVAYLTVASFVFLIAAMTVLLFGPTEHKAGREARTSAAYQGIDTVDATDRHPLLNLCRRCHAAYDDLRFRLGLPSRRTACTSSLRKLGLAVARHQQRDHRLPQERDRAEVAR
jgi:hypothetical protein